MKRLIRRRIYHRARWRTWPLWAWLAVALPLATAALTVRMVLRFAR